MSGMRGDVEEHPANSNAGGYVSIHHTARFCVYLHSSTIAIAMNIIRTWWYPITGTKRRHPVANGIVYVLMFF